MDKMMNSPWVMKIIALMLALMLYMSVSIENQNAQPSAPAGVPLVSKDTEILTDYPVTPIYDANKMVVTGVPSSVTVTLEGPSGQVKKAALQKNFEINADLSKLDVGTHRIPLKPENTGKLNVTIKPAYATVNIQDRVAKDFSVDVVTYNENKMEDGYIAQEPIVKPNIVRISGARELIESIDSVEARVDLRKANETFDQEARIMAYDIEGNLLSVDSEPSVVDVTIPVTSPSKTVPFKINRKGKLKEGLSIVKLEPSPAEVTIYGPKDVIEEIDFIDDVTVDLDKITKNTTLEVDAPVPKGVKKIEPAKIKIKVEVEKEEKRTFTDLPIEVVGLGRGMTVSFTDPRDPIMSIDILGAPDIIKNIKPEDLELFVNVTDVGAGEREVKVEVNGPQNIRWKLPKDKVKLNIEASQQ